MDAVEASVSMMEDNPLFNAGVGAPPNADGVVELDASIVDGVGGYAGSVAAVKRIKNPVRLARLIMERKRHVLLMGEGAERYAQKEGMMLCDPSDLLVTDEMQGGRSHGTVGCVALDNGRRIAAATSTGGIPGKHPGRVGDSALIGCGTYADPNCGVSCTGIGEAIIRTVLAKTMAQLMSPETLITVAAKQAIALLAAKTGSEAGLIALNAQGEIGYARNTTHMPVAWVRHDGGVTTDR